MSRGALPGVGELNRAQSEEYERRVDRFKDGARDLIVQLMGRANPGKEVWLMGAVGDQTWDIAPNRVVDAMPPEDQVRLDTGHHVMRLEGGGVGLKLDDQLVAQSEGVGAAVDRFKRALLDALAEKTSEGRGVAVVVFDVDDTLVRGTDDAPPIPDVVALYRALIDQARAQPLAREWGLAYDGPDHHISCYLVTARPYGLEDLGLLVSELLAAGVPLPPHPCSVIMRPAEMHECPNGPLSQRTK